MRTYGAYGLEVQTALPWPGVPLEVARGADPVRVDVAEAGAIDGRWSGADANAAVWSTPDSHGRPFELLRGPSGDHLMRYGDHARFWLAADGRHLLCSPGRELEAVWMRELLDTVLLCTALLAGADLLHASAVARHDRGVVLLGPSGAGKSTLAARLLATGWTLVADDAVRFTMAGSTVLAHPAPAVLNVPLAQWSGVGAAATARATIGGEVWASPGRMAMDPLPLAAIVELRRGGEGTTTCRRVAATVIDLLPHALFLPGAETGLFATYADVAVRVPLYRLSGGLAEPPRSYAEALMVALGADQVL